MEWPDGKLFPKAVVIGSSTVGRGRPTATFTMVSTTPPPMHVTARNAASLRPPCRRIQAPGIPTAKSRKIGLPVNEIASSTLMARSWSWRRSFSHRAPSSSKPVSGPWVATWCSRKPNGMPTMARARPKSTTRSS